MSKKDVLCHWKKEDIREGGDELRKVLCSPTHFCKKCARASKDEKLLCKPEKL